MVIMRGASSSPGDLQPMGVQNKTAVHARHRRKREITRGQNGCPTDLAIYQAPMFNLH